jgi:phosphatidylinositol kinase/protein kinase (PI-3  family)
VITALLDILKDQSLSSQHHTVIEAVMSIFKTQGLKCVTFLPQVREFNTYLQAFIKFLSQDHTGIRCCNAVIHSQTAGISSAAVGNPR